MIASLISTAFFAAATFAVATIGFAVRGDARTIRALQARLREAPVMTRELRFSIVRIDVHGGDAAILRPDFGRTAINARKAALRPAPHGLPAAA